MRKRKNIIQIVLAIVFSVLLLFIAIAQNTTMATAQGPKLSKTTNLTSALNSETAKNAEGPANSAYFEIRYDEKTNRISAVGISADDLATLNILPLHPNVVAMLKELGELRMSINGNDVTLTSADGTHLATINWEPETREAMIKLIADSTAPDSKYVPGMFEALLASSDINIVLKEGSGTAKAALFNLPSAILTSVDDKGKLYVMGYETPVDIGAPLVNRLTEAGLENAGVCYNKGTFKLSANGEDLPSVTIHKDGFDLVNTALGKTQGLTIGDADAYFNHLLGAVVVLPEGELPEDTTCGVND